MKHVPLSVLDLAPIRQGGTVADALHESQALARCAETWGYLRFWVAEHHGMPGIASAATALVIERAAAATTTLRIGAGGIMLPNHSPLIIAEQFGTLEALYPGRIDLGLGRAPGTDRLTALALRRHLDSDPRAFPEDVLELQRYFAPADPAQHVRAIPGEGANVPLWILGSSLFGAQVAAALGLPFGFASHFAPAHLMPAITLYRENFRPSAQLERPYVLLGYNVFAADSEEQAHLLASSMQQAFVNLRTGRPTQLLPPVPGYLESLGTAEALMLREVLACSAIGSRAQVQEAMSAFVERTGADELMLASMVYDADARRRSYQLAAEGWTGR